MNTVKKHNHRRLATSIACALFLTSPAAVQAAKTALVIGNQNYQLPQLNLPNPKQDAEGMAQALKDLGFDVIYHGNLNKADMEAAFHEFGQTLRKMKQQAPGEENVALFYYAGHGAEYQGTNYLLAADFTEKTTEAPANANLMEKKYDGIVPIPSLYGEINAVGETTNIFIVDACRNNPLLSHNEATGKGEVTRSVGLQLEKLTQELTEVKKPVAPQGRGLRDEGEVVNTGDPSNSLFAYSTAKGGVAMDGTGKNSPYTQHLLALIKERGVLAMELFGKVENQVKAETKQEPWLYSSGKAKEFYFVLPRRATSRGGFK